MTSELKPLDISAIPELARLVEEVRATNTPRVLRRDSEDVAILAPIVPAAKRRARRPKTPADYEAFLASAGGWKDLVDTEQLKADIAASRRLSIRPPVAL